MDREQEDLQFLGFFGIINESFKIIFSWRKIFSQITLALILPLSFIFLAHIQISQLLFFNILDNEDRLDHTQKNSPTYAKLSDVVSSEKAALWAFKAAYFTFLLILSLLSTSAVVYTIASIYTAKEITFKKVLSVVPKVWIRLFITFICSFAIVLVYNIVAGALLFSCLALVGFSASECTIVVLFGVLFFIIYSIGFVYISIVWHLASVVSVLEDVYGFKAMIKSKALIKGKMWIAVGFFILLFLFFMVIEVVFENFVVLGMERGAGIRILVGILCLLFLFKVILFGLVVQTVIYFVCKSYHHENIDKSSLADHLEVYLGEYVPLKAKDLQLEEFHV